MKKILLLIVLFGVLLGINFAFDLVPVFSWQKGSKVNWVAPLKNKSVATQKKIRTDSVTVIYIQPFTGFSPQRLQLISTELQQFYHVKTRILPYTNIYAEALLSGTQRYDADTLLACLARNFKAYGHHKILGLTHSDIFSPKEVHGVLYPHWGIFGYGFQPGVSCMVSDFRLMKFKGKTDDFVVNVVLHEIGHTFGLDHCDRDEKCLMNDAKGTIETLKREQKWLCPACIKLLQGSFVPFHIQ